MAAKKSAGIKYNVKGVKTNTGPREVPKPGVYTCKVTSCVDATPSGKDRRLEVQYTITEGDNKGFVLYDYINLVSEASEWKLAQFVNALGLPETGELVPDDIVGTALSVRTRVESSEQYGVSAKPATLLPLDGEEAEDEEEDLEDDEVVVIVVEAEADDDEDEEDEEDVDNDDEDDTEEDAASDDDDPWTAEDLAELNLEELREAATELDVDVVSALKGKKKASDKKAALTEAILEAQGEDDEEDTDEEDGEEEVDYNELDLADLKKLAKERGLLTKGSKTILVKRLEKSDEPV